MTDYEFFKNNRSVFVLMLTLFVFDAAVWFLVFGSLQKSAAAELYFLSVGQGDSELLVLPSSNQSIKILIDGGAPNGRLMEELAKILLSSDNYIDLVIMTHPQLDHFGGLIDALKKYQVGLFISAGRKGEITADQDLRQVLTDKKIGYLALGAGDGINYFDNRLKVIAPAPEQLLSAEVNDSSLVIVFENKGFRALYTGDISGQIEKSLAQKYDLAAQILKVSHHGSKFSSDADFLKKLKPQVAVIGVGKNTYGHPTRQALERLEAVGAKVFRTDEYGTIKIVYQDNQVRIFSANSRFQQ